MYPERVENSVLEDMRKAMPSPGEGQEDEEMIEKEKRHENEAVEFVVGSRKRTGYAKKALPVPEEEGRQVSSSLVRLMALSV